ncbi:hypothetical protein [Algoriphagus sp. CAU 1675]|uniref:hypothetical protein n=1 Tax=Algoriphagus sp. CAU 1675 TaxID=3032597 RepID=UPI0023DC35DE|nr:hypothetical protein [Algoriphagus sp. CAU 1675]MDF2158009.1 hypothetical protein [Algoriphagus sp. CAU 1675]
MKKHYMFQKGLLAIASAVTIFTSCISDGEEPLVEVKPLEAELLVTDPSGEENLRKSDTPYTYIEVFKNQIMPSGEPPLYDYLPGSGVGLGKYLGKSYSFINQKPITPLMSEGAPVTMFFEDDLAALGITDIPDNVSSVTVSNGGHALFFESGLNEGKLVSNDRIEFEADLTIVDGRGKFEGVTGTGKVTGFFNPNTGEGQSKVIAEIIFE